MAGRGQGGASNVDPFDAYFRRADLDRDGRISGTEAVSFFQGANLPKNVLAQIWNYADQNRTGFLGRAEFYNALRLVTVAQRKRELTSDIVKAALYSPASAKIPAPQINLAITPTTQTNAVGSTPPAHLASTILPSQSPGPRTMSPQFASMGQQYNMSLTSQSVRPPISVPLGSVRPVPSITSQGLSGPGSTFGSNLAATGVQMGSHGPGSGLLGSVGSLHISSPGPSVATTSTSVGIEQKEPALPNGYSSFGGDVLSAAPSQVKNNNSLPSSSCTSVPVSSRLVPGPGGPRSSVNPGSLDSLLRSPIVQQVGGLPQRVQSVPKPNQPVSIQRPSSGPGLRPAIPAPSQPHQQWPRISQFDVQKYTKVFVEVDADKDGKITGEQARNLFLSWRLPREILKQVWDLSDQDNDSMLSLREFCIALYLMERYREGRPLPSVLPNNILHDMHLFTQPTGGHGHASWGSQQMLHASSARHVPRPPGKPPLPVPSHVEERSHSKQQKLKVPVLEKQLVDQLSEEEQKNLNSKFEEATEANKKVEELEKEIKESREKIEFCRTKMQELVLYKSRCDNRLNEITARVAADKREAEMLAMKYEETYREKGDVASKLTLEEATFRDIQERKMELYRAIVKLEQDGGSGDKFKGHVDQIQSNLEELVKSLNQRCKNYGLRGKPMTVLELPFGWQPGIQEGAADWDEYWDKFEDEGFTFVKELTVDVQNVIAPSKTKTKTAQKEKSYNDGSEKATATSDAEAQMNPDSVFKENGTPEDKAEASNGKAEHLPENGTAHDENEAVTAKSSVDSASTKSALEISQDGFSENHYDQVVSGSSPRTKDVKSEHKGFGEPAGGSFNNNDDNGSVWASTAVSASKDNDDLFGPGGLALNPIKTGSLFGGDNVKGSSVFADSVPSTPLFPPSFSPSKINEASDNHHAPTFSRFDSFRSTDSGFQPSGTLARFDSMRSSKDFDHGGGFSSFDDSDPFGSGPFRSSSLGTETPRSEVDPFGGSSSLKVSLGSETPRSDLDPFGGGPFRSIFGGETPRTDSDPFGRRSSFGSETPRGEMDSFGAGPLKSTFGSETPRGEMDYSFGAGPLKSTFGSETPRGEMDYSFGAGPFASSFGSETPRSEYEGFGSVGPFKSSFGSETPRSDWMGAETPRDSFGHGGLFMSSMGSETPRSEIDPFGSSGPFRSSFGAETPRRDSEPDPFGGSGPFKSSFANETPRGGTNNWSAF